MSTQTITLIDGVLRRDIEALERRKHVLEQKHAQKVAAAWEIINAPGRLPAGNQHFADRAVARSFLSKCSSKPGEAPNIQTAPLPDYHEWALVHVELQRLKLTKQKLIDRIRSEYALGRLGRVA